MWIIASLPAVLYAVQHPIPTCSPAGRGASRPFLQSGRKCSIGSQQASGRQTSTAAQPALRHQVKDRVRPSRAGASDASIPKLQSGRQDSISCLPAVLQTAQNRVPNISIAGNAGLGPNVHPAGSAASRSSLESGWQGGIHSQPGDREGVGHLVYSSSPTGIASARTTLQCGRQCGIAAQPAVRYQLLHGFSTFPSGRKDFISFGPAVLLAVQHLATNCSPSGSTASRPHHQYIRLCRIASNRASSRQCCTPSQTGVRQATRHPFPTWRQAGSRAARLYQQSGRHCFSASEPAVRQEVPHRVPNRSPAASAASSPTLHPAVTGAPRPTHPGGMQCSIPSLP